MVFENYKIEGDFITLNKKELEEKRKYFSKLSTKYKPKVEGESSARQCFYLGKADSLMDILKMFELLEGKKE